MIIADRKFVVDSSLDVVRQFLLRAIMRSIPFEAMELVEETRYIALLKIRLGWIAMPMHVEIELVENFEAASLVSMLKARGMGGLAWLNQKATLTLAPVNENKTEVTGKIVAEGMSPLLRTFLLWKVKSFAKESIETIEKFLREWTAG